MDASYKKTPELTRAIEALRKASVICPRLEGRTLREDVEAILEARAIVAGHDATPRGAGHDES